MAVIGELNSPGFNRAETGLEADIDQHRVNCQFALFAGGTMTVLLIGMTMGSGSIELAEPAAPSVTTEPELAT